MRRVSKKRAALMRVYVKRRDAFLTEHTRCERCGAGHPELHHARGRVAADLLDESTWRALCHDCHQWVTDHPADAIAEGWSLPRVGRAS